MSAKNSVGLACGAGLVWLSGCVFSPFPDARTPLDRAHELDVKCRGESPESAAAVLARDAIDSVEPYNVTVPSSSGHENRMLGARIHLRPLPNVSSESLARTLQCHEAAVVGRGARGVEDDPYVLPGDWLRIDVASEGNGFVASAYPVDFHNGAEVLARARRYARPR